VAVLRASIIFRVAFLAIGVVACGAPPATESPARRLSSVPSAAPEASGHNETPPRKGDRFAVASENETAVEVARALLERGGSATDAAVGGILVACAAHPASCGLGGGGSALTWDATKKEAIIVDFRETAPGGIKRVDYVSKTPPKAKRGLLVGVPGFVAGLSELHRRGGKLPWATVVALAANTVDEGIPLSPYMAQAFVWNAKWLLSDARARSLGPADAGGRVGEKLKNPALASALRSIAERGATAFYTGPLADDLIESAHAAGSRIGHSDLQAYKAIVRTPVHATWGELDVFSAPPSSAAGITVLQLMAMFDRADLTSLELASGSYVHALAEGFRAANQDRTLYVGDPDFSRTDSSSLFDLEKMKTRRGKIKMNATVIPKVSSISESGTLHFVVVDEANNVVSLTASISGMFGSRIVTKGGYVLNDTLSEFNIDDYGMRPINKGPNFARGRARPVSSLVPTLVLERNEPVLALGASGGLRAPTAVTQVLFAYFGFRRTLAEAVEAPRFHVASSGALKLDEGLAGLAADLIARGEIVDVKTPNFSSVVAIGLRREAGVRVLEPVFDPRKGGAVTTGKGDAAPPTTSAAKR